MIFTYNTRTAYKTCQQGLTLLEMLVAMAIVAILLTVVAPNIQIMLTKNRITASINTLSSAVQYARFSAIDQNTQTTVCPASNFQTCSSDWSQAVIVFVDANNNGDRESSEPLLMTTEATSAQQYFDGPSTPLVFTETGATNSLASFVLCPITNDSSIARSVNVNQQGRTRISIDSNNDGIHEDVNGTNISCS
ncbi:MAG: GspH/FimT family pseudopilin [Glaciecola sp.]